MTTDEVLVHAFVHQADLDLTPGADPAAPGGAVTKGLCGHWEHEGPCRWPHHNAIEATTRPARFRTVFVAPTADEAEIRARIDHALATDDRWSLLVSRAGSLLAREQSLARNLQGLPPPG